MFLLGTVECNPDTKEAAHLVIKFADYDKRDIYFPPFDRVNIVSI